MADSVSRKLIIAEATRRGFRVELIGQNDHYCKVIAPDGRWDMFRGTRPMRSSANGFVIAKQKHLTMEFVRNCGYEVPAFVVAKSYADGQDLMQSHSPVVVKPLDAQRSEGVTVGVSTELQLRAAIEYALGFTPSQQVMVQEQLVGKLYRLYALDGKIVAAAHRKAAEVVGDGNHTVQQLVELLNTDPRRGDDTTTPLKHVHLDAAEAYVGQAGLASVPAAGKVVRVVAIESVSAGGEAINVTETVHPDWQKFTTHMAEQTGLFVAGYDVMCEDIAKPLVGTYIPLLEINSSPGLKLHEYPTGGGEPIHIAPLLFDILFA